MPRRATRRAVLPLALLAAGWATAAAGQSAPIVEPPVTVVTTPPSEARAIGAERARRSAGNAMLGAYVLRHGTTEAERRSARLRLLGAHNGAAPDLWVLGAEVTQRFAPGLTLGATLGSGAVDLAALRLGSGESMAPGPVWQIAAAYTGAEVTRRRTQGGVTLGQGVEQMRGLSAEARVGYSFGSGAARVTPFALVRREDHRREGYTETGGTAPAYSFAPQDETATIAALGVTARFDLDRGGWLSVTAGAETDLERDADPLRGSVSGTPFTGPATPVVNDTRPFAEVRGGFGLGGGQSIEAGVGVQTHPYSGSMTTTLDLGWLLRF